MHAHATGAEYLRKETNAEIQQKLETAWNLTKEGRPVILDVYIDYSKNSIYPRHCGNEPKTSAIFYKITNDQPCPGEKSDWIG